MRFLTGTQLGIHVVYDRGSVGWICSTQFIWILENKWKGQMSRYACAVNVGITSIPSYPTHSLASLHLKIAPAQPPKILHVLPIITSLCPWRKKEVFSYHSSWSFAEYLLRVCIPGYTSKPPALLHSAFHLHSLLLIKMKKLCFPVASWDFKCQRWKDTISNFLRSDE